MASSVAASSLAVAASDRKSLRVPIVIATLLALGIASYFWIDSRYPALLKKLHSGAAIKTSGVLSFDAKMPVAPTMPLATRIEHTTINWMWTNRIGMTFSLFFGAAVLTLLPLLPRRRFRSAAANTALGAITGVPLGVCANCVAPIGQSLYEGGASSATVLATMISSPMLNVVVLTMVFALFPPGIALLRVAVPLDPDCAGAVAGRARRKPSMCNARFRRRDGSSPPPEPSGSTGRISCASPRRLSPS